MDALGRRRDFPVVGVGLCLALAAATAYPVAVHAATQRRLSEVGARLAGGPMEVHCQSVGEASVDVGSEYGVVAAGPDGRPGRRAVLAWEQCHDLRAWARDPDGDATLKEVVAVHVLTHEAMHVSGITDEAVAECMAVQRDARTAQLLGAGPEAAAALAGRYWREVYPRVRPGYSSPGCRPGGALDERLADAPWWTTSA